MINQTQQSINRFSDKQVQVIRRFLSNLQINQNNDNIIISEIAHKIYNETTLQTKSIQQIQNIIKQILFSTQNQQQKQIHSNQQNIIKDQHMQMQNQKHDENDQYEKRNMILSTPKHKNNNQIKMQNQQASLISKSLFKSFNTPMMIRQQNQQINNNEQHNIFINTNTNNTNINNTNTNNTNINNNNTNINNTNSNNSNPNNNNNNNRKLIVFPKVQVHRKNSTGFISLNENMSKQSFISQSQIQYQQLPSFGKKQTKQYKQQTQLQSNIIRSKRKIIPKSDFIIDNSLLTSEQKIGWIQNNTNDCHSIIQKKLIKKNAAQNKQKQFYVNQKILWIYNQHFYGNYDKFYFNQQNSQLNKLYRQLDINPQRIRLKQKKLLSRLLPRARLFTSQFIISQHNKLAQFRSNLRQLPKDRSKIQQIQLLVGRQVMALHPICGHLHSGTILAIYKQNQHMIKFTRPELGTQKVLDINISTRSLLNSNNKAAIQNIDYQAMVIVIKLLQYKGELIERFKQYNSIIQQTNKEGKYIDNSLLQQYGWLGSTINILSMGLRHIIAKFRIRGLNQSNQQIVGKNFSSLLINPLNLMSKQLQNSSQMSDIQTSKQIKQLAQNRSTSRIQFSMLKLSQKLSHYLLQSELMNPQQKQHMNNLIQNFIGVLLNLRYQGRNFNIQSNKYLNNIIQMIDSQYPEYFNQIYSNLHTIIKKINYQEKEE